VLLEETDTDKFEAPNNQLWELKPFIDRKAN